MSIYDFITSKSSKVENTKDITNITENVLPDVTIDTTKNVKYDSENKGHPDAGYFNELDPKTGFRYDIPMLRRDDPGYYYKYVSYMKTKEQNEETFNKIMMWE